MLIRRRYTARSTGLLLVPLNPITVVATVKALVPSIATTVILLVSVLAGAGHPGAAEHGEIGGVASQELPDSAASGARSALTTVTTPDNQPLSVEAPYLNHSVIDSGQRLVLLVNITGGFKPYNITWLGLPGGGCRTHNQTSFGCDVGVPSGAPTTFEVYVHVIDMMGASVTSNATPVTVNPAPIVAVKISPISGGVPPFALNFTAEPLYGTPPFRYFWMFSDGVNATGAMVEQTFTSLGVVGVTVWGNDSLGSNTSGNAKVHSVTQPSVSLSLVPQANINQGSSVSLVAEPSGGLGPFLYHWEGLPSFCPPVEAENTSEITCSGAAPGTYTVTVVLTDSLLHSANFSVSLTVTAPPSFWEYVAIGSIVLAIALAIVVLVQIAQLRKERPPPGTRPVTPVRSS